MAKPFSIPTSLAGVTEAFADYAVGDELTLVVMKKGKESIRVKCLHEGEEEASDVPDEVMERGARMMDKGYG